REPHRRPMQQAASTAEDLRDARALRLGHVQAALRAAPQHVVCASGPFVVDEVAKLALAEPRAIVLAQATIADHLVGAGAVAAKDRAQRGGRDLRVPCEECIAQSDPRLSAELASRKRRSVGP